MKMTEAQRQEIRSRYEAIRWTLNERMHRLWAATEAKVLGHGGVTALSGITGLSRIVIQRGIKELEEQAFPDPESGAGRIRRSGAGPKPLTEKSPKLLEDLESLVEPETRGDPMSPLRWTTKSLRTLADELREMGYEISHTTVGELLHGLGYSLQSNDKVLAGQADHPDRDAQFSFINAQAEKAMDDGNPVLSVDTKKKELIGNYKNAGQTWEPKGSPVKVQLTFRNSKIASGIFEGEDFSTRIRRRTSRLRAVFPVFDGVGLALNGSRKGLRSERSLQGMRRDGRVGSSGQVRESR